LLEAIQRSLLPTGASIGAVLDGQVNRSGASRIFFWSKTTDQPATGSAVSRKGGPSRHVGVQRTGGGASGQTHDYECILMVVQMPRWTAWMPRD
jgi:hypothetical protein